MSLLSRIMFLYSLILCDKVCKLSRFTFPLISSKRYPLSARSTNLNSHAEVGFFSFPINIYNIPLLYCSQEIKRLRLKTSKQILRFVFLFGLVSEITATGKFCFLVMDCAELSIGPLPPQLSLPFYLLQSGITARMCSQHNC